MTKTVMGDVLSGEAETRWDNLSNASKLVLLRAKQQHDAVKAEQSLPKPPNWGRFSNADKITWFHGARESS